MDEKKKWAIKNFIARRFTSFRFTWSVISLFLSFGTFLIVFTDRFHFVSIELLFVIGLIGFFILAILFDRTGMRQSVNASETMSSPISFEVYKDIKEIKELVKVKQ